jgi:hypothetical protein
MRLSQQALGDLNRSGNRGGSYDQCSQMSKQDKDEVLSNYFNKKKALAGGLKNVH